MADPVEAQKEVPVDVNPEETDATEETEESPKVQIKKSIGFTFNKRQSQTELSLFSTRLKKLRDLIQVPFYLCAL